jgi:hypothetical protein
MEWDGERLTEDKAKEVYANALLNATEENIENPTQAQDEQYAVMKYLQKHLKGLRFREL